MLADGSLRLLKDMLMCISLKIMTKMIRKFHSDRVFFTSDTHFNHSNIIYLCRRPFSSVDEMNGTLIKNWNSVVKPDDIVFHLGDFALGDSTVWNSLLDKLQGHIYLICGNHDHKILDSSNISKRFEAVADQMMIDVDGQKILLNHYPFFTYSTSRQTVWQLFGHVHSNPYTSSDDSSKLQYLWPIQYDVGVDNNYYSPISFNQLKTIIQEKCRQQEK